MAQAGKMLSGQIDELIVVDGTGRSQHHAVAAVIAAHKILQRPPVETFDFLRGTQDRATHGLFGKGAFLEQVKDQIVRCVVDLGDFLLDDPALAFQFLVAERRVLQDIGQHVDRERHVVFQDTGVVGCLLTRGISVDVTADIFDLLGDGLGIAPFGALERHVFQQMGYAVQLGRLIARTDVDPNADRDALDAVDPVGNDTHAVV